MKILIDMNLSPDWAGVFQARGWEAVHWSQVGAPDAPDRVIMEWARKHGHLVFTHDLDFGALLAATHANGPSVIQVRTQDVMPSSIGDIVLRTLRQYEKQIESGVLISLDESSSRVRLLPLRREE
jgi:predicted nuclease of predicted toxin-antitoxin system